jgi:hypothetical protein
MRIEGVREESVVGWHRIAADVIWEDRPAERRTLAIETTEPFAGDFTASPDAFLTALFPLAQWSGERRVLVEGRVCTRVREGIGAAMQLFAHWYERCRPIAIEATQGFAPTIPRGEPRAACFLSGGIDALALLRANRLEYPPAHPGFIRDGLLIFGLNSFDADAAGPRPERLSSFEAHVDRMRAFADSTRLTLVPMRSNIRSLYPDFESWIGVGLAAGLVSSALGFATRFDHVEIGSSGVGPNHPPYGSHPCLDHHYSTEAVTVRQAQASVSRFEKTRMISEWDHALAVLRTCLYHEIPPDGRINCGACEKCIRTMLALVALGRLDHAPTFPHRDVTPSMLAPVVIDTPLNALFYTQCRVALAARNRTDLVAPIQEKIDAYHRRERRRRVRAFAKRLVGV